MKTELKDLERITIDARELLFLNENAPTTLIALVRESLLERGISLSRDQVMREVTIFKKDYVKVVIEEARRIIKQLKGIEYDPNHIIE